MFIHFPYRAQSILLLSNPLKAHRYIHAQVLQGNPLPADLQVGSILQGLAVQTNNFIATINKEKAPASPAQPARQSPPPPDSKDICFFYVQHGHHHYCPPPLNQLFQIADRQEARLGACGYLKIPQGEKCHFFVGLFKTGLANKFLIGTLFLQ